MFGGAANPYDEIIIKATDENLASEDWALNIEVCDKVTGDGSNGARNAVAALQKRLSHRNPNVQLYALELANTLAQNCGKPMMEELASRNWTQALDRLVNDRATSAPVKKKALGYIKAWAKQFEETGDSNLGMMGELYDQLRGKNHTFDEPEPVPEDRARTRQEAEDDELQRVLELSKQDRGGRNQPGFGGGSSTSAARPAVQAQSQSQSQPQPQRSLPKPQQYTAPPPQEPEPAPMDINTATRVRALYTFSSNEVGELNFERGDMIKVLDRGFQEWWRGACNGKIGIFPVTYVEPLPEPTTAELQREAQEEAQVFASLGLVDQLLQTLKEIDPARGDRLDDKPEVEAMYQDSVKLQGQINALIKKYSDQKAELEHMNANFNRAMRQYEEMRTAPPPMPQQYGYVPPSAAPGYDQQYAQQQHPPQAHQHHSQGQVPQQQYPAQDPYQGQQPGPAAPEYQPTQFPQANPAHPPHHAGEAAPGQPFYAQHQNVSRPGIDRIPSGAPSYPPNEPHRQSTEPGAAGMGAADQSAAWEAYYRQQAEQGHGQPPQQGEYPAEYGASPYPPQHQHDQRSSSYGHGNAPAQGSVDGVTQQMGGMRVHGQ